MMSEGGQEKKTKYQLLYHSIQEKLNQILQSKHCSIKDIRASSSHQINPNRNVSIREQVSLNRLKTAKKVAFHSIAGAIDREERNNRKYLKTKKSLLLDVRGGRSLNCSFACTTISQIKSNRSLKINPELQQSKKCITQILHSINIIQSTRISQKQIIDWLQQYCRHQKAILLKLFLKYRKVTCNNNRKVKKSIPSLEIDKDALYARLQIRLKDLHLGQQRFIKAKQIKELGTFLQNMFLDKMKMNTKEFEETVSLKMRSICERIRKEDDNYFFLQFRKKPAEISNFLSDVKQFEGSCGTLRKINNMNRARFKILNDADDVINKQVISINTGIQTAKRMNEVSIIS